MCSMTMPNGKLDRIKGKRRALNLELAGKLQNSSRKWGIRYLTFQKELQYKRQANVHFPDFQDQSMGNWVLVRVLGGRW